MAKLVPEVITKLICRHEWKHVTQEFVRVDKRKFQLADKSQCTKCPKTKLDIIKERTGEK